MDNNALSYIQPYCLRTIIVMCVAYILLLQLIITIGIYAGEIVIAFACPTLYFYNPVIPDFFPMKPTKIISRQASHNLH